MFEKYRGLILTTLFLATIIYLGYRNEKNVHSSIQQFMAEEREAEKIISDEKEKSNQVIEVKAVEEPRNPELTPSQVEEIVKNYLLKNPQVIENALNNLHQLKMEEMKKQVEDQISSHKTELEESSSPVIGNPNGKSKIVMFYDYNCGYCKQSADAIESVISSNSDVKVILKLYPILGSESEFLAKLALSVYKQNPSKFKAIHDELISNKILTKENLISLFKEHSLDYEAIENLAESTEITDHLRNNIKLAKELRINGVPAFVINGNYYPGFLNIDQLLEKSKLPEEIKNAKEGKPLAEIISPSNDEESQNFTDIK